MLHNKKIAYISRVKQTKFIITPKLLTFMSPKTRHKRHLLSYLYFTLIFLLGVINNIYSNTSNLNGNKSSLSNNTKSFLTPINDFTNFENLSNNGWDLTVAGDVFDWQRQFRSTPSLGTGPQSGAADGDVFVYIEASPPRVEDDNAYMQKAFDFTNQTNAQISFSYHMYSQTNSSAGRLNVQVSTDNGNSFTTVSSIIGNQGIEWLSQTVDLSDFNGLKVIIRFEALVGTTFRSDVSLDEILVTSEDNPDATTLGFSFENSLDGWNNSTNDDFDWTNDRDGTTSLETGPSNASEGSYYMYIETSDPVNNGDRAFLQRAFDFTNQKNASITFDYHMFGLDTGTLNVDISTNGGSSFANIFSLSGNQGNNWFTKTLDLDQFEGQNIIIRFNASRGTGFRSDIAIDNVILISELAIFIDTDGDTIADNIDEDDDNDGILDIGEQCVIPGAAIPEPDRITYIEGDFDIFSIGGNTNGLGYQESGFQEAAFEKGMQLTVLNSNNDFTFPADTPVGGATNTTGSFINGTISYSSNAANIASRGNRFFVDNLPGGSGAEAIQILPSMDLVAGETYSIDINLITPVFAFSFDIVDILDTSANIDPTVVRYEIIADSQLVAYFQSEPLTAGNTRVVEIFDANDVVQGTMLLGHNVESTIGFITSGSAVSNISFVHKVIEGEILQDFHFINKFAWSTTPQSCFGDSLDFDQDGIPNFRDLDSDNDGIPDNIEAQSTIDYIAPSGVYNSRGIDIAYPSGIIAINTDRSGNSDFIDSDSDDDGIFDINETNRAALDTNNDGRTNGSVGVNGLDNSLFPADNYSDVNADINNPTTLPDIDGDVLTIGDVDYRDTHLSGTPLITQILQTPTDRVIEITNIHPTNPILANTIRLALFNDTSGDQTGINPDVITSVTSALAPNSSILIINSGSTYSGIVNTQITNFSDSNDILLLTHPGSISQTNSWKNRYETTFEIENNTSYVRTDEINNPETNFNINQWIRFVDENLDPDRSLENGGPERHPHAPLTSEIGSNANPESNTFFGLHRTGPTTMVSGDWNNGFPDRSRRVIISQDFITDDNINARALTIENGSKLTMNNSLLVVSDQINISGNNDQIRLGGTSQLVQTHTNTSQVNGSGDLFIDQNSQTPSTFRYNYMSSPVTSGVNTFTLEDVLKDGSTPTTSISNPLNINFVSESDGSKTSPISISNRWIFTFTNATGETSNFIHQGSTGNIPNTNGFTIKGPGIEQNYTFVGTPNDGNLTTNTQINSNNFYLLGNPYPSALNATKFIEDNINTINGELYFWQHASEVDSTNGHLETGYIGGYSVRNIVTGVPAIDERLVNSGADFFVEPGEYVPVAQGFFVLGNNTGNINFSNSQREFITEGNQSIFLKSNNKSKLPILKLGMEQNISDTRISHRQIAISFNKKNSFNHDNGYDSQIIDINPTDMYWKFPNNSRKYIIAGVGEVDTIDLIPLEIIINEEKTISIQIDEWNVNNQEVFILDKLTDNYYSLANNNKATISLSSGVYNDRFFVTFENKKTLRQEDALINNIKLYYNDDTREIIISNYDNTTVKRAELYSILGKKLQVWNSFEDEKLAVKENINNLSIIKLYTNKGQVSKKIFIK